MGQGLKKKTKPVNAAIIGKWAKRALEKAMEAARDDGISLFDKRTPILLGLANDKDGQESLRVSAISAINKEMRKNPEFCESILKKEADEKAGRELWELFYEKLGELDASRAISETIREFFNKVPAKPEKGKKRGCAKP